MLLMPRVDVARLLGLFPWLDWMFVPGLWAVIWCFPWFPLPGCGRDLVFFPLPGVWAWSFLWMVSLLTC